MLWSRESHWKLVRVLARVTGATFAIAGIVVSIWGGRLLLDSDSTLMFGANPTRDPLVKAIVLVGGVTVAVLGIFLLRARASRGSE